MGAGGGVFGENALEAGAPMSADEGEEDPPEETLKPRSTSLGSILHLPKSISKSLRLSIEQIGQRKKTRKSSVNLFQALTALKKGLQVWKLPHRHKLVGKAHMCFLRLSSDERYLYWYSHKNKSEVSVHLDQIVRVAPELPEDLRSWKGYSESLAFTVYFVEKFAAQDSPTNRDAPSSASREPGTVTFVCRDEVEHRIFVDVLRILVTVSGQKPPVAPAEEGGTPASSARAASLLPTKVMTTEIGSILRRLDTLMVEDGSDATLTPTGLHFSSTAEHRATLESSQASMSGVEDNERPSASNQESTAAGPPLSESTNSFPAEDRVIADAWVWGRGMDKVGNRVSDQVYPALLHGQKTLDAYQIACGEHHVVIIDEFGSCYTWGFSKEGQLGHGAPVESFGPMQVKAFEGNVVTQVSCGTTTTIAVTEKGEVFLWGQPMYSFSRPTWFPKMLDTGTHRVKHVSCGAYHFAMCTLEGRILTCGGGKFGALGHGSRENVSSPRVVEALEIYEADNISCGIWHTAVVVRRRWGGGPRGERHPGEVYAWGDNSAGQLGYADPKMMLLPIYVTGLENVDVKTVACGRQHTLALADNGELFSWGSNKLGQLGRKPRDGEGGHKPGRLDELSGCVVTEVASGMDHCLVIARKGKESSLYSWGCGDYGCLGQGPTDSISVPTVVQRLARKAVVGVACGANTSCAIVEHHFVKEIERADRCKQCNKKLSSGIRNHRKTCARCRVSFCKACVKQYALLKPLLPYNVSASLPPSLQTKLTPNSPSLDGRPGDSYAGEGHQVDTVGVHGLQGHPFAGSARHQCHSPATLWWFNASGGTAGQRGRNGRSAVQVRLGRAGEKGPEGEGPGEAAASGKRGGEGAEEEAGGVVERRQTLSLTSWQTVKQVGADERRRGEEKKYIARFILQGVLTTSFSRPERISAPRVASGSEPALESTAETSPRAPRSEPAHRPDRYS